MSKNIIYKHYLPKAGDQVIDLGVAYGDEAVYLKYQSPNVKYLGVEAQPVNYECVCNTFRQLGPNISASPFAVSNDKSLKFVNLFGYAGASDKHEGYIEFPPISWAKLVNRYRIDKIDLKNFSLTLTKIELFM